jgi:hypothetical protein
MISRPSSLKPASRLVVAVRLVAGLALLIIGIVLALPGVPGPGIPIVLLGLWLLSHHFAWARRALAWLQERTAGVRREMREGRWKWLTACFNRSARKGRRS